MNSKQLDQVDILLATYNGASFLTDQLESILNQTHTCIRLIVRDDGSTDSTKSILADYAQKFPSKMELLSFNKNLGPTGNFSTLMHHATANYIMFSDQDDVWNLDKVAITLQKMKELENQYSKACALLVHTDLTVVDADLQIISPSFWKYSRINPSQNYTLNRLLVQNVVTGCTMLINKSLLKLIHTIPKEAVLHDWWIALVAVCLGKIDSLPISTMLYRQHIKNVVGASNFWSLAHLKHQFKTFFCLETHKTNQATVLLSQYGVDLKANQKKIVNAFLRLSKVGFLKRRLIILKHQFFYGDAIRNAINIFLKPHP